jgi:hypothetical protein
MSMTTVLACIAVVAALVMTIQHRPLVFPIIALVVSGLEALMALHVLHFSIANLPLGLIFGGVLVVAGAMVYLKTSGKSVIAAATVVVVVGALQVLNGLHLR